MNANLCLATLPKLFEILSKAKIIFMKGFLKISILPRKDLGKTQAERNVLVSSVIKKLANINFRNYDADALGDAYEYLISRFASESGKKAGEFYTPRAVSQLLGRIVTNGMERKSGFSIYDPTMGSRLSSSSS